MTLLTILSIFLPLLLWLTSGGLLIFVIKKWREDASRRIKSAARVSAKVASKGKGNHQIPLAVRERVWGFLSEQRWNIALGLVISGIILFAWIFAPPRLTGNIPINPGQPGRPFYNLHWIRNFLRLNYESLWTWCNIGLSLLNAGILIIAIIKRSRFSLEVALLTTSLTLAGFGQWLLNSDAPAVAGWALYLCALLGFLFWAWLVKKRLNEILENRTRFTRPVEILILTGLFLLAGYNRLYALQEVPYGIEGDEAKWTSEAVNLSIRAIPDTSGEYHRDALPVSFYLQTPLHRILGASVFSARLTVALLSILGTLGFYWLLRQIAPLSLAALGAYFLSISVFDISASRLANVESFIKVWPILTLALLAMALKRQKWQVYLLSGLALALGLLTYDTLWPILGIVIILTLLENIRQKSSGREIILYLAALLTPSLLTLPILLPYIASRVSYYGLSAKGWNSGLWLTLGRHLVSVLQSWFVSLRPDFLYNRQGPLLNALLLPWLVLGIAVAILTFQKKVSSWMLLWMGLVIFPVPVIANSPLGRVYYPALPAIYALIALGIFVFWQEINRFLGNHIRPIMNALALIPLVWLPLFNAYIYFNEVQDATDRQIRREIGEMAAQAASEQTLILLPIVPGADEPLRNEYQTLELYLLSKMSPDQIAQSYRYVNLDELLPTIAEETRREQNLAILLDRTTTAKSGTLDKLVRGLQTCFPQGVISHGLFLDRYTLSITGLKQAACIIADLNLSVKEPATLAWEVTRGTISSLQLTCEKERSEYRMIEAENMSLGAGWQHEISFAEGWSGTGFVRDNYNSTYITNNPSNNWQEPFYTWVRYYKRVVDDYPARLSFGGRSATFADATDKQLNQWVWEQLGPFKQYNATNQLIIWRPYDGDPLKFMALFIDMFILTPDQVFTPMHNLREIMPIQKFKFTNPQSSGDLPLALEGGMYRCRAQAQSSLPLVDAFGDSPLLSNIIDFEINP